MNALAYTPTSPFQNLQVKPTSENTVAIPDSQSPLMNYDAKKNVIFIKGNSLDSNVYTLYGHVIQLISTHLETQDEINLYFYLNKVNTLTIKSLFDIFKLLSQSRAAGKHVKVTWFFDLEDHTMMDNAYDFSELFDIRFSIVPV